MVRQKAQFAHMTMEEFESTFKTTLIKGNGTFPIQCSRCAAGSLYIFPCPMRRGI
eukprot:SAG11_NODE_2366_length_3456_cov_1.596068_2_plen_55_part_00